MTTNEDPKPAATLAEVLPPEIQAPAEPVDLEARGEAYLVDSIVATRRAYFETNCPPEYRDFDADWPDLQPYREQINAVLAWKLGKKGLLLSGPSRRGKTRSAYALCRRLLCDEAKDVAIWQAHDFFSALQECVRFGRDEAEGFVRRQAHRRVFFLDDYGQHAAIASRAEWAEAWFFRFLDLRIGLGLPLIVTTNLTAAQMSQASTDTRANPIVARFLELAEPIKFP